MHLSQMIFQPWFVLPVLPRVSTLLSGITTTGLSTVTCDVSGSRPLTVELLVDGSLKETFEVFSPGTGHVFVTHEISATIGSIVQCVASNNNGSSQSSQYIVASATGMLCHLLKQRFQQ